MIYATNQLLLKTNQNILNPNFISTEENIVLLFQKYEFDKPDNNRTCSIFISCAVDCYSKYFDIEVTNGGSVSGITSEKILKKLFDKVVLHIN